MQPVVPQEAEHAMCCDLALGKSLNQFLIRSYLGESWLYKAWLYGSPEL